MLIGYMRVSTDNAKKSAVWAWNPSFQVYDRTGRWWCYTERRGGNGFDFLCQIENVSAKDMIRRLH